MTLKLFSPNYTSVLIQKIKIQRLLSQSNAYDHREIFTFTLPLLEGRAREARVPLTKIIFFLFPHSNKAGVRYLLFSELLCFFSNTAPW
jgi:hypothetical protein